jgi:hypothetical protein
MICRAIIRKIFNIKVEGISSSNLFNSRFNFGNICIREMGTVYTNDCRVIIPRWHHQGPVTCLVTVIARQAQNEICNATTSRAFCAGNSRRCAPFLFCGIENGRCGRGSPSPSRFGVKNIRSRCMIWRAAVY